MRLAYNDSMSPVEKLRYDRNLPDAASRHALDFTNLGALRSSKENASEQGSGDPRSSHMRLAHIRPVPRLDRTIQADWKQFEI
jgi:hypothetical protein